MAQGSWMSHPGNVGPCPPGLGFLAPLDQLLVDQQVQPLEIWTGYEKNNKYVVKNKLGEKVYWIEENSDSCQRCCFGRDRPIDITALDRDSRATIHMYRPFTFNWCDCHVQNMEVFSPPGHLIGSINQELSFMHPKYNLKNAAGDIVLYIEGPLITTGFFRDVDFTVIGSNGRTQVGKISKHWSGLSREMFSNADMFGVSFPGDLDVRMKAVVLAACFLIDFTYYLRDHNHRY